MFAYCENRPIIGSDPDGEWVNLVVGAAIGVGTQFVTDVLRAARNGRALDECFSSPGEYAAAAFSGAISSISGGGLLKASVDIIGSSYIQECVNIVCEKRSENYSNIAVSSAENAGAYLISAKAETISAKLGSKYTGKSKIVRKGISLAKTAVSTIGKYASNIISILKRIK